MAHGQAAASDEAGAASTRAEDELAAGREEVVVKVGMVGDTQIGKTSLMVKFVEGTFDEDYIQTLGVNFMEKTVGIRNANISFSIWDLGGQREFINMLPLVCNDAAAILFMFDLSRCGPIPGPLLARQRLPHARTHARPTSALTVPARAPSTHLRRTFMWCTRSLSFTRTRNTQIGNAQRHQGVVQTGAGNQQERGGHPGGDQIRRVCNLFVRRAGRDYQTSATFRQGYEVPARVQLRKPLDQYPEDVQGAGAVCAYSLCVPTRESERASERASEREREREREMDT